MKATKSQYESLQWRAHRLQGAIVDTPALTWHRVFWRQENPANGMNGGMTEQPVHNSETQSWADRLERTTISKYFTRILKSLHDVRTPTEGPVTLFDGTTYDCATGVVDPVVQNFDGRRPDTINFRGTFLGLKIRVRAGLFSENWMITVYVELSSLEAPDAPPSLAAKDPETENVARSLELVYAKFGVLQELLNKHYTLRNSHELTPGGSHRDIAIRRDLLENARIDCREPAEAMYSVFWEHLAQSLGLVNGAFEPSKIADFRGLVLYDGSRKAFTGLKDDDSKKYEFPKLFDVDGHNRRHGILTPGLKAYEQHGSAMIAYLWPLITASHTRRDVGDPNNGNELKSHEYTCTTMLDGNAIYCSSLGATGDIRSRSEQPVTYLVVTSLSSRWQVGRLLDRLHQLGTLRLAALYDFNKLEDASQAIKRLGELADGWWLDRAKASAKKLSEIEHKLSKETSTPWGGLSYRIEKSRYYVKLFETLAKDLRSKRIEGFQSYDNFVKRRLNADFVFIDTIGTRFERLQQRLRYYNSVVQTEKIARIQEAGEFIAVFCLVPYYLNHIISTALAQADIIELVEGTSKIKILNGYDSIPCARFALENMQVTIYVSFIMLWYVIRYLSANFRSNSSAPVSQRSSS